MSGSDEEFDNYLDEQVNRQESVTIRRVIRDFQNPFEYYSEVEFKQRYRFRKETVLNVLMPLISHNLEKLTKRGLPIPPVYQLLIALRFYASASFQIISGDLISVSQPTVSRIVKRVSYLISLQIKRYIKFPENSEYTKLKFYQIAQFPGVRGCIDCTHVAIQNPGGNFAEVFRNRKKFFSINTQLVCGPELEIYDIVADRPGSVHDNRIFQASTLKAKLEGGEIDGLLLGDSGYGCQTYLLTPVLRPESDAEQNYNKAHIKTRNTVERTIGVWKRIFPCVSKKLATNLTTTCHVVVATAILYNICRLHNEIEENIEPPVIRRIDRRNANPSNRQGLVFRRMFIERHF
ncbi:unnamed protein product [Parnassius mnemosyne]|uniref:DDE Tnp4 domain-containing protein n=1 Tax=Parnassius mnemosyne TaxID=213953 RepID=A0AAV1L1L1_9NEOP